MCYVFQRFENGAYCYKKVIIQYNGQQVQATVTDQVCLNSTIHIRSTKLKLPA